MTPLPIDDHLAEILEAIEGRRSAVIIAPPGSGKTTRVPPALAERAKTILLQPRRIAARSLARRIAEERRWTVGREVGWQIRGEKKFIAATKLLVATEGILTARLQTDPLLGDYGAIVIDEFHERSIHADLALALAKQAWLARDDLRLVVMSATLDAEPVSRFLNGAPVISIDARTFPVEIEYAPGTSVAGAAADLLKRNEGDVLTFLPGALEIRRAEDELRRGNIDASIFPLHGRLSSEEQDAALRPARNRKIILATNIAETSLTVDGVTAVVDTGVQKTARYDAERGIDLLVTERISLDSAAQRAGRAGRTAPGRALRLWDARDILRARREPEIERVDLAAAVLEVLGWGGDPSTFDWFEKPPNDRLQQALNLLERLRATRGGTLTDLGRQLRDLPLHPRLGAILLAGERSPLAAAACAILSESRETSSREAARVSTDSDLLSLAEAVHRTPSNVQRLASELGSRSNVSRERLLRAISSGYPDRVAKRRETGSPRLLLASGSGATLSPRSGVVSAEWIVAVEIRSESGTGKAPREPSVEIASRIEKEWLEPTGREVVHWLDASGTVRAIERETYGVLALRERPIEPAPEEAERVLRGALRKHIDSIAPLLRRAAFAGVDIDLDVLIRDAVAGRTSLPKLELPRSVRGEIDRLAPETLQVPSGRGVRLDYRADGAIVAAVKLQELFGLGESPRIGKQRIPVTFSLLSPAGRPVQTTTDLASFWKNTYPEVRKELRARYPKHPWPEDPWNAVPTARAKKRER